jgi:peptidoglycan/xylan/chitin deacetylase (PgdA/CDA1 family)
MKRLLLCAALSRVGVISSVLRFQRLRQSPRLTILTYHRAQPSGSLASLDPNVVAATKEGLESQIAFCKRHFDIIGIDDLLAYLDGKPLPRAPVLITFDDGYLDNYEIAYPILKRYGTKAVFFVATWYLEARRLFWWDRVHYLVKTCTKDTVHLSYPYTMRVPLPPRPEDRGPAINALLTIIKEHHALDLPRFLSDLAMATEVVLDGGTESQLVREHLMTWDHVRELRRGGMDVQSHTHTHRVLQTLPLPDLARDLSTSKRILERVLGEPVRAVAYPVGRALSYAEPIRDAVRRAGFELGFSNRSGINAFGQFDPLDATRIPVNPTFTRAYFESILTLPGLAYPQKVTA